jgi:hypothetical protein
MIKFGKSEKIELSGFAFQNIQFWPVQRRIKERAKFEDPIAFSGMKDE